jgi:cell division control protein 6
LYGKTGTGKTVVAHYVIDKLSQRARDSNLKIRLAYTNTRVSGTSYRVLSDLATAVDLDIPFSVLAIGEVLQRKFNKISQNSYLIVFILDEIDYLVKTYGDNLLYELTRSYERLSSGFLSIIGISNDLQFKEYLDPRVLSSLSEEEIVFPPYTADEIRSILQQRVDVAFDENAVSPAAINICAALAGSEHGDARRAVDLLRVSAEIAEREGAEQLSEKHVRIAVQKIERDRLYDALISLPLQAKILLLSVLNCNLNASTSEVYERYKQICKRIGIEVLTQRRTSSLLSELDLLGLVTASVISHGRYGRTKKINASISFQVVREVFMEDPILSSLL